MKKILVTGATGFIGNHVITQLIKQNYFVIASSSNAEKAMLADWYPLVTYIPFDLLKFDNEIDYYSYFQYPNAMIHLAWEGLPNYTSAFHLEENFPRHFSFIKNLVSNGLTNITITGTCFEYGKKEGCLSEDMHPDPLNSYAIAKDTLRKRLEELQQEQDFILKWVRLFYMFGQGQNPNSLLSLLNKALENGATTFNMSGGEQERDYLAVEHVALYVTEIALQNQVTGIINCCSGTAIKVKTFVRNYLSQKGKHIRLNFGYYPYVDYEPMSFWGDVKKLNSVKKMVNPVTQFENEKKERLDSYVGNQELMKAADTFNIESNKAKYSYNFSWMGRPIIQYPQDMIAMQEILWDLKPDLIIETGIAHGGSLIYYASILELIGKGEVLGIDIDIREHNRTEIETHPMSKRIKMLQGSSTDLDIINQVRNYAEGKDVILVVLDSNHTHEHVLAELNEYAPFVSLNSYIIVYDTIVEKLPNDYLPDHIRPWSVGNNPMTAVKAFIEVNNSFKIDTTINNKLLISVGPDGYLKKVK